MKLGEWKKFPEGGEKKCFRMVVVIEVWKTAGWLRLVVMVSGAPEGSGVYLPHSSGFLSRLAQTPRYRLWVPPCLPSTLGDILSPISLRLAQKKNIERPYWSRGGGEWGGSEAIDRGSRGPEAFLVPCSPWGGGAGVSLFMCSQTSWMCAATWSKCARQWEWTLNYTCSYF